MWQIHHVTTMYDTQASVKTSQCPESWCRVATASGLFNSRPDDSKRDSYVSVSVGMAGYGYCVCNDELNIW